MKNELILKAEKLAGRCAVCAVASISEEGFPRICALITLKNNGIKEFWFSTGTSGTKVRHFRQNDKAGVTFFTDNDSVTLTGNMDIVTDKAVKDGLWREDFLKHFPNGGKDDPEYCVLHFVAKEATIYVDNEFETHSV